MEFKCLNRITAFCLSGPDRQKALQQLYEAPGQPYPGQPPSRTDAPILLPGCGIVPATIGGEVEALPHPARSVKATIRNNDHATVTDFIEISILFEGVRRVQTSIRIYAIDKLLLLHVPKAAPVKWPVRIDNGIYLRIGNGNRRIVSRIKEPSIKRLF